MTLFEVLLVIATAVILAAILLPLLAPSRRIGQQLSCANNLKQVGLAFRIWEGDNDGKYPMAVSVTNGGAMELVATGNVTAVFQVMSNELSPPKILFCPADDHRVAATNFTTDFTRQNISYFVGVDANKTNVQMLLAGDDNFESNGVAIQSGLSKIPTNTPITWSATRHKFAGYITFADGSVQQLGQTGLQQVIAQGGVTTNRLAVP